MPSSTVFTAQASRGSAGCGEAGRSGGSLLRHGSGRAACRAQCSQRCQFRIVSPVLQHLAVLTGPEFEGWQNPESHSPRAHPLPRPHRTAPVARRCGEIKSHRSLSCLKPLGPAPALGLTPWFSSLELARHWNTHGHSDEGRQHLEAIIPLLLYLSPTPHPCARKRFILSTNLYL